MATASLMPRPAAKGMCNRKSTKVKHEGEGVKKCGTLLQVHLFEGTWPTRKDRKPSDDDFLGLKEIVQDLGDIHKRGDESTLISCESK